MNAKTTLPLAAAILIGMAGYAGSAPFDANGCSGAHAANVMCQTIAGPASVTHKSLLGAGLGVCITDAGTPISCNDPTAQFQGAGAAIFDVSGYANYAAIPNGHQVDVWIEYLADGPCVPTTQVCGFDALLCNDRDYDGTCTNIEPHYDQLRSTQSNEPIVGEDCSNTDKDVKDCGDDLDAQFVDVCFGPAVSPRMNGATDDWNYGQIVVFIGAWVDTWPGTPETDLTNPTATNVGAGVAAGSFDVWLRDDGACTAPECADNVDNGAVGDGYDYRDPVTGGGDATCTEADDSPE